MNKWPQVGSNASFAKLGWTTNWIRSICLSFHNSLICSFFSAFLLELKQPSSFNKQPDTRNILAISEKIHLAVVRTDPTGESSLLGSHYIEWRGILCSSSGRITNSIEVNGVGAESNVPIGILDIRFDLIPRLAQVYNILCSQAKSNKNNVNIDETEWNLVLTISLFSLFPTIYR